MTLSAAHRKLLLDSAITPDVIDASGIRTEGADLVFPWNDGVGPVQLQRRPDNPPVGDDGQPVKYLFEEGEKPRFNRLRDQEGATRKIIAEGTKQSYAVLSHAPADMAVYGMAGCEGWHHADLTPFKGAEVFLILDADLTTNRSVWHAAERLTKKLKAHGAASVKYVATTGDGKDGVDDALASFPEDQRAEMLRVWLSQATDKLGRRPAAKRDLSDLDAEAAKLFVKVDGRTMFQPYDAASVILERTPAAVTAEKNIALYDNGVFKVDEDVVLSVVVKMLGNFYAPGHLKSVTDVLRGRLVAEGMRLPERMPTPMLNCPNGMVDLRTGETKPHDPRYLSYVQVSTDYVPDMPTPVYDAWLREALRQPGHTDADVEALVADIEETAGTMLDPSKTPSKTLFLFGPSRSGKSTFLRLLAAIAGPANTSAVTLHNLATDNFAAANLYGRMLNVAADLSNKHVSDLSLFKMVTGEDPIQANRKYGSQFEFTNQALVAFSANELPTVSEASRAYAERMKPFNFPNSFAGREDKTLEAKLMGELPGILARWVSAYGRFLARGGYAPTDRATQADFEAKSDRVVQFFQDMCTLTEARHGDTLTADQASIRRNVHLSFQEWAERNGGSGMGERAFFQRFAQIPGVQLVRIGSSSRGYNVTVAKSDSDSWDELDHHRAEPVPDPVEPSGVDLSQDVPRLGVQAPAESPVKADPVPVAAPAASTPQKGAQAIPCRTPDIPHTCQLNDFLGMCIGVRQ